ncbi:MAG: TIGR02449 family protein [Gammaproteobacteria bacterium]|nr:TIGR02449 family protein [Gammaproteobacteria bacterium]
MDELDLRLLERRVDELIRTVERLKDENHLLRANNVELAAEKARLLERTELARSRVEAMISRLKGMEREA